VLLMCGLYHDPIILLVNNNNKNIVNK